MLTWKSLPPLAFGAALLITGQAQALSCLRPEVGASFEIADQRPEIFHIAQGSLTRIGENIPDGPDTGDVNNRVGYSFPARFDGFFATSDGFEIEDSVEVTVEVGCVAAWCGGDSLSAHGLYFLRMDAPGDYAFESGPCPLFLFEDPIEHQLMSVIGLMQE